MKDPGGRRKKSSGIVAGVGIFFHNFHKIKYSDIVKSEKTWYTIRDGNVQNGPKHRQFVDNLHGVCVAVTIYGKERATG